MRAEDLDGRSVTAMYELSHPLHERLWEQEGHRSYHHGLYEGGITEPDEAVEKMIETLADVVGIGEDDHVLNLGCGVGEDAVWLARERGCSVTGVNIHDRQLELARAYAASEGVEDQVTVRNDDFHRLETVEDDSVDVVWGLEALCHSSDDDQVIAQARRVLGEGGRLVLADLFRHRRDLSDSEASRLEKLYDSWAVSYDPLPDLTDALDRRGFTAAKTVDVTDAVRPSVKAGYRNSLYGYPYYRLLNLVGRADDRLVEISIGGYHCYKLIEHGTVGYYIVTARV